MADNRSIAMGLGGLQDKTAYYNSYPGILSADYRVRNYVENIYRDKLRAWYPNGLPDMYSNPSDLSHLIGSDDYYPARHVDRSLRRPMRPAINYYLDYGHKYANRFKYQTRQRLSPQGQRWLDLVFLKLQYDMENKLRAEPYLEYNADELKNFAFGTHPEAYTKSGFFYLPSSDWGEIFFTVDKSDSIFDLEGLQQMAAVLWEFKTWMSAEAYKRTYGKLENYLLNSYLSKMDILR